MKFFIRKHHGTITVGSVLGIGGRRLLLQRKPGKFTPANTALLRTFPANPGKESLQKFRAGHMGALHSKDKASYWELTDKPGEGHSPSMISMKCTDPEALEKLLFPLSKLSPQSLEFGEKWNYRALEFFLVNVFFLPALAKCALQLCVWKGFCGLVPWHLEMKDFSLSPILNRAIEELVRGARNRG